MNEKNAAWNSEGTSERLKGEADVRAKLDKLETERRNQAGSQEEFVQVAGYKVVEYKRLAGKVFVVPPDVVRGPVTNQASSGPDPYGELVTEQLTEYAAGQRAQTACEALQERNPRMNLKYAEWRAIESMLKDAFLNGAAQERRRILDSSEVIDDPRGLGMLTYDQANKDAQRFKAEAEAAEARLGAATRQAQALEYIIRGVLRKGQTISLEDHRDLDALLGIKPGDKY
jgi:hypothetical protein